MKLNIRQRVFRLVLSASVLTFLVLAIVTIISLVSIHYELDEKIGNLSKDSVDYVEEVVKDRKKSELKEVAQARAQQIDRALNEQSLDADYLAKAMEIELRTPTTGFTARNLATANYQQIKSGEAYIFYTPALLERGINSALAEEIDRAGNIATYFLSFCGRYQKYFLPSFMAASKNGYFICLENTLDGSDVTFSEEFLATYDFRTRPWYKLGENTTTPLFTDVYTDTDGNYTMACVMSYRDPNGDLAGVVSIAYGIEEIYKIVLDTAVGSDGFSFILNSSGEVILSAKKEGIFAAKEDTPDLRQSDNTALAETARKMAEGESGVASVVIDDEEFYLAYSPMTSSGWSFGTVMKRSTVLAPAIEAREKLHEHMEDFRNNIRQIFRNLVIGFVVVMALLFTWMFIGSSHVSKRFVEPIQKLSEGVREFSGGNLDKKIAINTGDELEELADSFNTMTNEIKNYMANLEKATAAEERIATELKVATNIQLSALPHDFLEDHSEFEIYATMHAAKEVGGDLATMK